MLIDSNEKGRERERERAIANMQTLIGCLLHAADQGWNLQPRRVPWLGIKPATSPRTGRCSDQLSHTDQEPQYNI